MYIRIIVNIDRSYIDNRWYNKCHLTKKKTNIN